MTDTIERAATKAADRAQRDLDSIEPRGAETPRSDSIGQNLPPLPRASRRALVAGRRRLRPAERLTPFRGAALVIAVTVASAIVLAILAQRRRRSRADGLMARLEQVPERISALGA